MENLYVVCYISTYLLIYIDSRQGRNEAYNNTKAISHIIVGGTDD